MRAWAVLAAVSGFFGLVFALRSWLHRRATGHSGVVAHSAARWTPAWWAAILLTVGACLAFGAPLLAAAGVGAFWWPASRTTDLAGAALMVAGALGTWWSQSAMGASWRVGVREGERTRLVTGGPFRWVRNPIFSFVLVSSCGLLLVLPHPAAVASLALMWIGIELQVRAVEEAHLRNVHGESYLAYCRQVGRFVPGLGRMRATVRD